jgi:hypothetical protein
MQVSEQKTECQFTKDGQTLNAVLHLIEVRYNARIVFWNGVAQLTSRCGCMMVATRIKQVDCV